MLTWNPSDILALTEDEANLDPLEAAGYKARLLPPPDEFQPIERAEHYVIVGNGDAYQLAKRFATCGAAREWQISVNQMGGFQDLTHALAKGGVELVRTIIAGSKTLHHDEVKAFVDIDKPENIPSYKTGWPFLDSNLRYVFPELGVLVGPYGGGKSALAQLLSFDFADVAGRELSAGSAICCWEDSDWKVRQNLERFAFTREGNSAHKMGLSGRVTDLLARVYHITRIPNETRDLPWFFDRCELLIRRHNVRHFTFDPWNEGDHHIPRGETETQVVNELLKLARQFTDVHKIIFNIVTHVGSKTFDDEGGIRPFRLSSAHGSSNFGKKADRGLCIARSRRLNRDQHQVEAGIGEDEDRMILRFDKAKDEENRGERADLALDFDRSTMDIKFDLLATQRLRKAWRL
jgi:hypothetical protein